MKSHETQLPQPPQLLPLPLSLVDPFLYPPPHPSDSLVLQSLDSHPSSAKSVFLAHPTASQARRPTALFRDSGHRPGLWSPRAWALVLLLLTGCAISGKSLCELLRGPLGGIKELNPYQARIELNEVQFQNRPQLPSTRGWLGRQKSPSVYLPMFLSTSMTK